MLHERVFHVSMTVPQGQHELRGPSVAPRGRDSQPSGVQRHAGGRPPPHHVPSGHPSPKAAVILRGRAAARRPSGAG